MRLAAIIQVAVGIFFVFILLSIVVTEVNSLIARATKMRAKTLRSAINAVIEDPIIRAKVYTHPLIQLVKADPIAPTQRLSRREAEKSRQQFDWLGRLPPNRRPLLKWCSIPSKPNPTSSFLAPC